LEQKQSTLIYVQSEEKINRLLRLVGPEKAGVIGKHDEQTSDAQEMEILEKLESGELIAVVSNATFSTLTSSHPFEHFVFCHLVPSLDVFCERCQPAFTSARNVYLHLIYESKQNIERYPKDETIRELYRELQKLAEANDDFINHENVYNALNMKKLEIETGLVILEELQYLERKKMGIKLLQSSGKQLEESTTYCRGEKLRVEAENSPSFQYEHSVEQIWEEIQKKVDIGNERILRENNISTELEEITVESLTESVEGISETTATETTEKDRNDIAVQVVELRINAAGLKPLAWKCIREKLGLKYNQFHKDIRHSAGYRKAVIDRIKSLKAQEGGWEYSGKLDNLTGIDDISEDELK
jgi:precorrin-6B methylase 1